MKKLSVFDKTNNAYNLGKKANQQGKSLQNNPFEKSNGTKNFDEYNQWIRGWFSENVKR